MDIRFCLFFGVVDLIFLCAVYQSEKLSKRRHEEESLTAGVARQRRRTVSGDELRGIMLLADWRQQVMRTGKVAHFQVLQNMARLIPSRWRLRSQRVSREEQIDWNDGKFFVAPALFFQICNEWRTTYTCDGELIRQDREVIR